VYVRLGGFRFDPNSVAVATRKRTTYDAAGLATAEEVTAECSGEFLAASQGAYVALCARLEAACRNPAPGFALYTDAGQVALSLPAATAFGGLKVPEGPDYPQGEGPEFVAKRTFRFVVSATYPTRVGTAVQLVSYQQKVRTWGGGRQKTWLQPMQGLPVEQTAATNTPFRATQSGQAVGALGIPPIPPPLWPLALNDNPVIETDPISRTVTWEYQFSSARRLR
jgi:hypothetical protein